MHSNITSMLQRYACHHHQDYVNALKEIVQEVALIGLWRAKFFDVAAFYGGTALRILFQLDRFSEDLDFTLLSPNTEFELEPYLKAIKNELDSFGFEVEVIQKTKSQLSNVQSAFLKGNTLEHLLKIATPSALLKGQPENELLKIKLELDTDPPPAFETTTQYLLQPIPCAIRVVSESDLFAGKMHALLCRNWKNRIKGRDWYDFVWYIAKKIPLNLAHLEMRMRQSGHYNKNTPLNPDQFRDILISKIESLDISKAKLDVLPFVRDPSTLSIWSKNFFLALINQIDFKSN